jgi:hypothetical protein
MEIGYVSHSIYHRASGLALRLGCIPRSAWDDPSAGHSGYRFVNEGPKDPGLERSQEMKISECMSTKCMCHFDQPYV